MSKAMKAEATSAATPEPHPGTQPAYRLKIRVKLPRVGAVPASVRPRLSTGALLLILGVVVLLLLSWVGISKFRKDPASSPAATEQAPSSESQSAPPVAPLTEAAPSVGEESSRAPPPATAQTKPANASGEAKLRELQRQGRPGASPSSINEVVPDVPVSARNTIRGTIKVSVRVIVDKEGKALVATADARGPSRYFERLAVEAARKWTFTPAKADEERIVLVTFDFTRAGTVGRASPAP